jgi:hypothetical protein
MSDYPVCAFDKNRCGYCGFPLDTPKRAHDFIHQQGECIIENIGAIRQMRELLAEARVEIHNLEFLHGCVPCSASAQAVIGKIDAAIGPRTDPIPGGNEWTQGETVSGTLDDFLGDAAGARSK